MVMVAFSINTPTGAMIQNKYIPAEFNKHSAEDIEEIRNRILKDWVARIPNLVMENEKAEMKESIGIINIINIDEGTADGLINS